MRTADRIVSRKRPYFIIGQIDAERVKFFNNAWIPYMTCILKPGELPLQLQIVPIQKITENMQFRLSPPGTEFDAGNDFDTEGTPGCDSLGQTGDGVVIRDG